MGYEHFLIRMCGAANPLPNDKKVKLDGVDKRPDGNFLLCAAPAEIIGVLANLLFGGLTGK
ncbi:hypothetical protein AWU68_0850 [Corynebacterium simulans]|nr:hypothetical protein AWU68_0850 [Corynebacterium simulans]